MVLGKINQELLRNARSDLRSKRQFDQRTYRGRRKGRKGDGETLIDKDGGNMEEAAGKEGEEDFGRKGSADTKCSTAKTLKREPTFADERASVAAGLRIKSPEYLE